MTTDTSPKNPPSSPDQQDLNKNDSDVNTPKSGNIPNGNSATNRVIPKLSHSESAPNILLNSPNNHHGKIFV